MTPAPDTEPVVKEVVVSAQPERAWDVFTGGIGSWWPVELFSVGMERTRAVVFEGRRGGRIFERWGDGTEKPWGEVEEWDPPHRVRFSWHPNEERPAATEVEVTFTATGDGTRVRLEHRGWERLGDAAAESRGSYDRGWVRVLDAYVAGARDPAT